MSFKVLDLRHCRILPKAQLVARKSVRRKNLLLVGVPLKSANLRTSINGVEQGSCLRIPEFDRPVGSSSSSGEEVSLMRRPSKGLNSSLVVSERKTRSRSG
jgi:hypothetical protein